MDEPLHCLVEILKGSRNKCEWDERLGGLELDRFLFSTYKQPEGKEVQVDGWYGRELTLQIIDESRVRWREESS